MRCVNLGASQKINSYVVHPEQRMAKVTKLSEDNLIEISEF